MLGRDVLNISPFGTLWHELRHYFRRSTAAPAIRPVCHLLRIVAVRGASDADAGGACRATRGLADRRWHVQAGEGAGGGGGGPWRGVPVRRHGDGDTGRERAGGWRAPGWRRDRGGGCGGRQRRPGGPGRRLFRHRRATSGGRHDARRGALAVGADLGDDRQRHRRWRWSTTMYFLRRITARNSPRSSGARCRQIPRSIYAPRRWGGFSA